MVTQYPHYLPGYAAIFYCCIPERSLYIPPVPDVIQLDSNIWILYALFPEYQSHPANIPDFITQNYSKPGVSCAAYKQHVQKHKKRGATSSAAPLLSFLCVSRQLLQNPAAHPARRRSCRARSGSRRHSWRRLLYRRRKRPCRHLHDRNR